MVVVTWVGSMVIDKAGRRPLLLLSGSVMCLCAAALGAYFYLKQVSPDTAKTLGVLPIISLSVFIIVFSLGFGPIPWMFVSEIFPPQIKGAASSIACLFNWVSVFFVTRFYNDLLNEFGAYGTFWIFAGISAAGTFFIWSLVIETKGKSMEEIQRELGGVPQMTAEATMEAGQKPTKF